MRCDEIQEHLIDLLYDEGASPENPELQNHLRNCPNCRQEYEELRQTRKHLRSWKDESPLRSASSAIPEFLPSRRSSLSYLRYAAVAAMVVICFLIFAGAEITLDKNGFSYHSHLFSSAGQDTYTKSETRDLVKRALVDSELRADEANNIMARRILDMVDRERWIDTRLVGAKSARNGNRN